MGKARENGYFNVRAPPEGVVVAKILAKCINQNS